MFADAFLPVQNLKRLNIFNNYKLFSSYFYKSHTGPALSSLSDTIMDIEFGSNVFTAVPWDALQGGNSIWLEFWLEKPLEFWLEIL